MPLFFILSGYVFSVKKQRFKDFALKKLKRLIIPYFVLSFINLILDILWNVFVLKNAITSEYFYIKIKGILLCYSDIENMPNCSPLWFLVALFFCSLFLYTLTRLNNRISFSICIVMIAIGYLLAVYFNSISIIPWKLTVVLMATPIMYLGYVLSKYNILTKTKELIAVTISILLMLLAIIVEIITRNEINMNVNEYGNLLFFIITTIGLSLPIIYLFYIMRKVNFKFLRWIGKRTIFIIGFNYFLRTLAIELYYHIPFVKNYRINFISEFIITFVICVGCLIIIDKVKALYNRKSV